LGGTFVSEIQRDAIDTDVHVEPQSMDTLLKWIDPYWYEYIRGGRIGVGHRLYPAIERMSARPEARAASGGLPPATYDELNSQLLTPYEPRAVILNCLAVFQAGRNPYYETAIARAVNEWIREEFLDKDERLRASIVVPVLNPEGAVEEIDRLAEDPRYVQILLPIRSDTPWGNLRWRHLHEAATRHNLPIALHAGGAVGNAPTTSGSAATYYEDYLYNSQIVAPAQVLNLIAEGVFDRYPTLRICLSECGYAWIPSLMWRYDKDWKALWREVPWVREKPFTYLKRHFRATTSPIQIPARVSATQVAQLAHMLVAWDFLMYSSDYPHDHGDDALGTLFDVVGEDGREAIIHGNAERFYSLAL
jgi:predicted TIM-barrel fold metal-dependent hydrolase